METLVQNPEAFLITLEEEKSKWQPVKYVRLQLRDETSVTLGAFCENKLIGAITLQLETYEKIKHKANVVAFFVSAAYREQGVGKQLLAEVIAIAKMRQIEILLLSVVSTNHHAICLYQSFGFMVYGMEEQALKWRDEYVDELHMMLKLHKHNCISLVPVNENVDI